MPALAFRQITKRFGSLTANDNISLSLANREILALLGENGAGKTTLMNILFGHYVADEGVVDVNGQPLVAGSTEAAINAGIGMVHQHFTLADNLTVLENIVLGTQPLWSWRLDLAKARSKLTKMMQAYALVVDPDALVSSLSVGERQRVEIMKALYRDARILILDEPTAVLTPQETENLFVTLRSLTADGLSVIFISHKLNEILRISDRVAVLRRGKLVNTVNTKDTDRNALAEMMVGDVVNRPKLKAMKTGNAVLTIDTLHTTDKAQLSALSDINLSVHQHEIVGIAGVAGNGQSVLVDILSGINKRYRGNIHVNNASLYKASPSQYVQAGVGRIPEDRHARGVVAEMSVWENLVSENIREPELSRWGAVIKRSAAVQRAEQLIEQFDIRCPGPHASTKLMSGGNMQKLILARALAPQPIFIIANQPVRGLDEGAIAYVYQQLFNARERGAGILLVSEDLDELMSICDRIAVMYQGSLSEAMPTTDLTVTDIGLMMAGQPLSSGERRAI